MCVPEINSLNLMLVVLVLMIVGVLLKARYR